MSKKNLLGDAKAWFTSRGVKIRRGPWSDDVGDYGFQVNVQGPEGPTKLVVAAKNSAYNRDGRPVASFMKYKLVQRTSDYDGKLLLYLGSRDQFFVFDPAAFLEYGVEPDDNSDRAERGENWLDLPLDWGVPFGDWLDGQAVPKTSPDADDPVPLFDDQLGARSGTLKSYMEQADD